MFSVTEDGYFTVILKFIVFVVRIVILLVEAINHYVNVICPFSLPNLVSPWPADYEELATSSSLSMSRAVKAGTVKKNINVYSFRYLPFFQHVNRQS